MLEDQRQHLGPINHVERILEVDLEQDELVAVAVFLEKRGCCVDQSLRPATGANSDLEWGEMLLGAGVDEGAAALGRQSSEDFADSNGPDSAVLLGDTNQFCAGQYLSQRVRGLAGNEQVDDQGELAEARVSNVRGAESYHVQ